MPNTFPSNSVGSSGGINSTSSSNIPQLTGSQLPSYWNNNKDNHKEGFAASVGSAIELPSTNAGALTCYSSTGATLWTYSAGGAIGTGVDSWLGFWMNDDATLLYVVALDETTSPMTYFLISINLAGTIVSIGNDQPSVEFNSSTSYWTTNGMIQPDGSGGFDLYKGSATPGNDEFANMDSSGTFTTSPARMTNTDASSGIWSYMYKTDNDYWLYNMSCNLTNMSGLVYIHNGTNVVSTAVPYNSLLGITGTANAGLMQWRDYVVSADGNGGGLNASRKFSKAQINTFALQLATYAGVKL